MDPLLPPAPAPRSAQELSRLVHLIYDAAAHPQAWNNVVAALGESLGASKGLLVTPFLGPQDGGLVFPWRIPEQELQLWATRYIDHDIWSMRARERGLWHEGAAYVSEDMVSADELRNSVFYREFLRPHGIESICTGIVFAGAPGLPHTSTSFFRDRHAPPFSRDDKSWLQLLLTHLSRSLGLMHRLKALELRAESLRASLDRLAFGVVLLDERRQVLHTNACAAAVLARNDGLLLDTERRLEARSRDGRPRLQPWLAADAAVSTPQARHFSGGFLIARAQDAQQYLLQYTALPASDTWQCEGHQVRYVVFITDPGATRLPPAEQLAALYGLTRAEASVALFLAQGKSQKEMARELAISLPTARTHTQRVFAKTRVHRHADLVRTILSLGQAAV